MTDLPETDLFQFMRTQILQRAKVQPEMITPDVHLTDLGIQSIDAVLLCGEIEDRFEVEIDPAEIFEHDSLGAFAQTILARLAA